MPDTVAELASAADFGGERREIALVDRSPVTIHRPLSQARGTVVLVPGWSGPRSGPADLLVFLAAALAKAGWLSIRMDIPGRGDSEGSFADVDLDGMIHAADAVAAEHASEITVLLGLCSGGNVSLGAATIQNPKSKIQNGVIALSTLPFQPARSKEFEQRRRWKNIKNYAAKALSPGTWVRLAKGEINMERVKKNVGASEKPAAGERNLKDSARDIEKDLLGWRGPALFIWGGGDEEAALARAHYEKLHAAGMGSREHTTFHTIPGANHNFYSRAWREELLTKVLEFLSATAGWRRGAASP